MSWIKATVSFIHAVRHPDEIALEVETELHFHIEMRRQANIEEGMTPDEAQRAAVKSFGDLERIKHSCCEIWRSLPFDSTPLRMGLHIAIAVLSGWAALWAVNIPHSSFTGVLRQLVPIAVLTYLFVFVRRARSKRIFAGEPRSRRFGISE
ncbi:hypothetical protein BH20ACI3_BH20ACI3_33410 [soil metagenome]